MLKNIKYLNENSYQASFLSKNNSIDDYNEIPCVLHEYKMYFTPVLMSSYNYNNGEFVVRSDSSSNYAPIHYAFNNSVSDLGTVTKKKSINIYYDFMKNKKVQYIKFKLNNQINNSESINLSSLKLTFYGSNKAQTSSKQNWIKIDECNIGFDTYFYVDSVCYFDNKCHGEYLNGNPVIICKFDNDNFYKYYRLNIKVSDESSLSESNQISLYISKMRLYDDSSVYDPIVHFSYINNSNDSENEIIVSESKNISFNDGSEYNGLSYIRYPFTFSYNLNSWSISFFAQFNNSSGIILSKKDFQFSINENRFYLGGVSYLTSNLNNWHHYAIVFHNDNMFVYLDGKIIITASNCENPFKGENAYYHFNIGCKFQDNSTIAESVINYMKIKHLSIYDYAINTKQIHAEMKKNN